MASVAQFLRSKASQTVWSTQASAAVYDAIAIMAYRQVGALIVVHEGRVAGIVTERDYARKVILHGRSSQDIALRDIMTCGVVTVEPSSTVEECMSLMTQRRIRHLPVCDGDKLVGLVSIGDLVKAVIAEQEQTIKQLESYIHS